MVAGLTEEQLALRPSADRWPIWATIGHTACQRVFWLCDVFGDPLWLFFDPAWRTADVAALAQAAYQERLLPEGTLEGARLRVLADALEETGCSAALLLEHLRRPGLHVRGCWAVDLLRAPRDSLAVEGFS